MYLLTVELDRVGVAHLSQNILSVTLSYKPFLRILTSISYYLKKKKKKKGLFSSSWGTKADALQYLIIPVC